MNFYNIIHVRNNIQVFLVLFSYYFFRLKLAKSSVKIYVSRRTVAHKSKMLRTKGGKARKALEAKRSVLLME